MVSGLINDRKILFSSDIYSEEAVKLASYVFEGKISFSCVNKDCGIEVQFNEAEDSDINDFCNEVLNQQCRIDLSADTAVLTKVIVLKALLSAIGEK